MEKKVKAGWSAARILALVYTILGSVFLVVGAVLTMVLPTVDKITGMIFVFVGVPFLILGVVFAAIVCRKKRQTERLVEAGRFVWAEVVDCDRNYHVRVNNRNPYILVARYTDGRGVHHLFRSQNVFAYGAPDLIGKNVKVYADEGFRHYYVDVQPLLGNYVEH